MVRTSFAVDPLHFLTGPRRSTAIEHVRNYFAEYTGSWFERLAATDQPHRFTEKDLVAVGTLGVEIPASTALAPRRRRRGRHRAARADRHHPHAPG